MDITGNIMDRKPCVTFKSLNFFSAYSFGVPYKTVKIMGTRYNAVSSFKVRLQHNDAVTLADIHISARRHDLEGQPQKVR